MGLLTDPSAGQGKITKALLKYNQKLCILLYVAGVVWFCLLAYPPMNTATYFSENALLPGLVRSEFRLDRLGQRYYTELLDEMKQYPDSIPYPWLTAKFRQLGLDTYTHNFTLNYPLGKAQRFSGQNVYGILRAARAASTESLVLSVPYRPSSSVHQTTAASIAVMLAFAKFANKEKYWAKDIIFLITEHEQLGIQAWLQAYHGVGCGNDGILDYGDLRGRAGAIQAAINLELHDVTIAQIDVKVEGLNGQLPNLDLFNLATKMCFKEHVYYTFKNRPSRSFKDPFKEWLYSFKTFMAMVFTQATGVPNGNHGLYHRFGIEALTIEGFASANVRGNTKVGLLSIGRLIEGIFRSLNNLLERFHQSYFFYLLPSSDRFVSIGLYMPAICLIAGTLFVKACAMWFQLQRNGSTATLTEESDGNNGGGESKGNNTSEEDQPHLTTKPLVKSADSDDDAASLVNEQEESMASNLESAPLDDLVTVIFVFVLAHVAGILIMNSPLYLVAAGNHYGYGTDASLFIGLLVISFLLLLTPILVPFRNSEKSMIIFNIFTLLELGTALIGVAMTNFSLAILLSVLYVPLALLISIDSSNRVYSFCQKFLWFLVHPLLVVVAIVLIYTYLMFPGDATKVNLLRTVTATQQAIAFTIVDSFIYGNWLFAVITGIFVPNWICFWVVAFSTQQPQQLQEPQVTVKRGKKTN